ncbi:MAG: hypothetical protein OSA45_02850 [Halioglobus sp.]|jgi:hypothetical protein|nr:hypothetical protein [Halioglobus sp.]
MNNTEINAQELSSRKLWQLAQTTSENAISKQELSEVVAELAKRRHNLEKLQEVGKLGDQHTD